MYFLVEYKVTLQKQGAVRSPQHKKKNANVNSSVIISSLLWGANYRGAKTF
jgi:hypothetical protein